MTAWASTVKDMHIMGLSFTACMIVPTILNVSVCVSIT